MSAPAFRTIGDVRHVPSFRLMAWKGWRSGSLDHPSAHRLCATIELSNCPNSDILADAMCSFARQHRVLGASYYDVEGSPWLDMSAAKLPRVEQFDALGASPERVQKIVDEFMRSSFEVQGALFRVAIVRTGAFRFRLVASTHHLISDNVSISLMTPLLRNHFASYIDKNSAETSTEGLDYGDYLFCMNEWFDSGGSREARAYWKNLLPASPDALWRPLGGMEGTSDKARYAQRLEFTIGGRLLWKIDALARHLGTTRFAVMLSAQQAVIASLNDEQSALIVAVTDGREHASLRGTLGYMADKVIYRSHIGRATTFGDLVKSVHQQTARSYRHRYFRYDRLLHELWPESAAHLNFAPPMFNFRPRGGGMVPREAPLAGHPGLVVAARPPSDHETHPARSNFSLEVTDRGHLLVGRLAFSRLGCELVLRRLTAIFARVSPDGSEQVAALTGQS